MARSLSFRGGVHIEENKNTRKFQIQKMPDPSHLYLSMQQHIGAACEPIVKPGDKIDAWQAVGEPKNGLGCPIHSGVSGKVTKIEDRYNMSGFKVKHVIIENDGENRIYDKITPFLKSLKETTAEEIIEIVKNAGIVGLGGAAFPTYAKISSAVGKVNTLIINCAECEPYITSNHRLMLEHPDFIINGLKILLKALNLRQGMIAVEDNKMDAVNKFEEMTAGSELIKIKVMRTKYPQGDERQLIYSITGQEMPAGKLPADFGCVIFNAETCASIFTAFIKGKPLVDKIITVDGDCIRQPKNVLVTLGSTYRNVIEFCGGFKKKPYKIISGGPMMGSAIWDLDTPILKNTSAIIALSSNSVKMYNKPYACIRCGRCAERCPMFLMPMYLASFAASGNYEKCREFDILSCVECGCCVYECPGNVPIVQQIRAAKTAVNEIVKNENAAGNKTQSSKKSDLSVKNNESKKSSEPDMKNGSKSNIFLNILNGLKKSNSNDISITEENKENQTEKQKNNTSETEQISKPADEVKDENIQLSQSIQSENISKDENKSNSETATEKGEDAGN